MGTKEGLYVSKIRERLRKAPGVEGAPQKSGDAGLLLGESKQVIWGLNLHSATWGDSITPPQPLLGWGQSFGTSGGKGPQSSCMNYLDPRPG